MRGPGTLTNARIRHKDIACSPECAIEKREADVHTIVDVGVVVVELLVGVPDAGLREAFGQDPRPVMDMVLVAPAAIDVDAAQRFQRRLVLADEIDGIVREPVFPACGNDFSAFEVERQTESERRANARSRDNRSA